MGQPLDNRMGYCAVGYRDDEKGWCSNPLDGIDRACMEIREMLVCRVIHHRMTVEEVFIGIFDVGWYGNTRVARMQSHTSWYGYGSCHNWSVA